ncbi:hypothetical protein E3G68_005307 [Mycobacteroides abscessus]|uniref:hypothetical protein n=1 Tax=Mycobacteroides abscessus TaxID=36809 RepID=UPI0018781CAE|nr:hypothetical protein [Mycobacteroides abscessus]
MIVSPVKVLLGDVLDAHGGLARWNGFDQLEASIVSGGLLYALKGQSQDRQQRQVRVGLREVRTCLQPFGSPDRRMTFTADRTRIETLDGTVLLQEDDPRPSFDGHELATPWTPLQRAYFSGYALWTYLNSPFLLARPDVVVRAIAPITLDGQSLDGIEATLPPGMPSHSRIQQFYFGPDRLLRRHDYHVDIAGGFPASQLLDDYIDAEGVRVPLTRNAYRRSDDSTPMWDQLMVSMQFSNMHFSTQPVFTDPVRRGVPDGGV